MDMSQTALRSLRELARLGTMAAVADATGYTPGAVSQQFAQLERAAGQPLLVKVGRRVRLTDAGHVLVAHAERLLRSEEEARRALQEVAEGVTGAIRVGAFATSAATLLAPSIITAAQRYPRLSVTGSELEVDAALTAVGRGEVDLAFGLDYPDAPIPRAAGIEFVHVRSERFRLAVPAQLSVPEPISLRDAESLDWILPPAPTHYGIAVRSVCRRAGFEPRVAHEITDTAVSLALASRGLGITPVTAMMLALGPARGLTTVGLREEFSRDLVLIRRVDGRERPAVRAMTEVVERVAASAANRT